MAGSAEEKRHPPSRRKLKKARQRGEAAVSRELAGALAGLAALCALAAAGKPLAVRLLEFARGCFSGGSDSGLPAWKEAIEQITAGAALVGVPAAALAFLVLALQVGLRFRLRIDFTRLDPVRGLKRIFSRERLVDLVLSLAKISLVLFAAVAAIPGLAKIASSGAGPPVMAPACAWTIMKLVALLVAAGMVFGAFDFWLQRRRFLGRMRMSRRELADEHKEQEGDPRLRAERRRLQRQLSQGVGLPAIRAARLVVANPTHLAVALAYRPERDEAPWVVVSGWGSRALSIRQAAERAGIPVVRQVMLARELVALEWGEEISEEHYQAVADVIHAVEQMENGFPAQPVS